MKRKSEVFGIDFIAASNIYYRFLFVPREFYSVLEAFAHRI